MTDRLAELQGALRGHYRVDREVAVGGTARVYAGSELDTGRNVAIKLLKRVIATVVGPERFLNEIRVTAALAHPRIVPLLDWGQQGALVYYVMPFLEGSSLREHLRGVRRLPLEETTPVVRDIAEALDFAHEHGVVHRDVKPDNIMLTDAGAALTDFGIAKALIDAGGERLTESGVMVGTPHYMSPEQAAGSPVLGAPSDQYSLACTAYEMLAGEPVFSGASVDSVIRKHAMVAPPHASSIVPGLPPAVDRALHRALAKDPARRYPSVGAFAEALVPS